MNNESFKTLDKFSRLWRYILIDILGFKKYLKITLLNPAKNIINTKIFGLSHFEIIEFLLTSLISICEKMLNTSPLPVSHQSPVYIKNIEKVKKIYLFLKSLKDEK